MPHYSYKFHVPLVLACILMLTGGCAEQPVIKQQVEKNERTAKVDPQASFAFAALPSSVPNDAADQKLVNRPDGSLVLSWWQNTAKDKPTLLISVLENEQWTPPAPVTSMANLIEAQVVPVGNDALAALWMVSKPAKNGEGEVHDIFVARGDKTGKQWTTPLLLNQEAITSMKESPTLAAMPDGTLLSAWIDMRNYKMVPPSKPGAEATSEGFTSLMVASVSANNKLGKEMLVDKNFCECCAPAMVTDEQGGLLAYREHLTGNVRDPAVMRISANDFGQSAIVHNDHWVLDGCPSKAPAIARLDSTVGIAWLTSVKDKTRIRAAFSKDKGQHFAVPIELELENAGGVSGIEMDSPHSALVAWTVIGKQGEMTKLARVFDDGRIEHRTTVHSLSDGKAYKWPGPRMTKAKDTVIIGWNDEQAKKLGLVKVQVGL
ncbi:MAG: hypothetical protein HOO93_18815 [Methyloglobulus sp.]|nr:hypothetical protein [Methyloglobulus sp.]